MTAVVLQVIADPMSLNINEDKLRISASSEIDSVCINFEVDEKLCGIVIKREDYKEIIKFIENQFNG